MAMDTTGGSSVENTTAPNMVVVRDSGHEHGAYSASGINPFSQGVNGSIYKYLLVKILSGFHSKWELYHIESNFLSRDTGSVPGVTRFF
jgi:hypothetical protein